MKGLTTSFSRPASPPGHETVTRELLGIPTTPGQIGGGARGLPEGTVGCSALYLVPQTLYKLHPAFDGLVVGILKTDLEGCAVFIRAADDTITDRVRRRMMQRLRQAGVSTERLVFVRR